MIPIIDKQTTAKRIQSFMEKHCLKPADIQVYLGLACVQTVYRWLEGVNIPTVDHLYALSQLFGIRMDDMVAGNRQVPGKVEPARLNRWLFVYFDHFYEYIFS